MNLNLIDEMELIDEVWMPHWFMLCLVCYFSMLGLYCYNNSKFVWMNVNEMKTNACWNSSLLKYFHCLIPLITVIIIHCGISCFSWFVFIWFQLIHSVSLAEMKPEFINEIQIEINKQLIKPQFRIVILSFRFKISRLIKAAPTTFFHSRFS